MLYSVFPLFHANAKYMSVLTAMVVGARLVIDRRFSASRFWEICRTHGITAFNGQGEMLRILLKQERERGRPGEHRPHGDRGRCSPSSCRVRAALRCRRPRCLRHDRVGADHRDHLGRALSRLLRSGRSRGTTCASSTPTTSTSAVGETGEIVVRPARNHVMMEGYWNNPVATVKAIAQPLVPHWRPRAPGRGRVPMVHRTWDGFDPASRRERSAWEVERVLADHPELLEAAVYGVPSELGGQEVMVAIVPRPVSRSRPKRCSTTAPGRCRTLRFRGTSGTWTSSRAPRAACAQAGTEGGRCRARVSGIASRSATG